MGACSDSPSDITGAPGARFLTRLQQDTIGEAAGKRLEIEYRDAEGKVVPNAEVEFVAPGLGLALARDRNPQSATAFALKVTTDTRGRASVYVVPGCMAAAFVIAVRSVGVPDSSVFEVLPGAATKLYGAPADTAVRVGRTGKLRAAAVDRCGNARNITASFNPVSPELRVETNGSITGLRVGRARVELTAGALRDSTFVSVVPEGRIATLLAGREPYEFVAFDLDGGNVTQLASGYPLDRLHGPAMSWSHDGSAVAISGWNFGSPTTFVRRGNSAFEWLVPEPLSPNLQGPVFSPDGASVYTYHAHEAALYRTHLATRSLDTLITNPVEHYRSPTISPDGRRLAYLSAIDRCCSDPSQMRVLDLTSGAVRSFEVNRATVVRWSPIGDQLAFVEDYEVKLSAPDGTGKRTISSSGVKYHSFALGWPTALAWSSDGKWLLVQAWPNYGKMRLDLIEIATGLTLPLGFTSEMIALAATWLQ